MPVTIRNRDSHRVEIEIQEALDRNTVPGIRRELRKILKKKAAREIDILAHGVSAIDTAGVALLLETWTTLEKKSGVLRLRGLNEGALRMIRLARLEDVLGGSIVDET